MTLKNEAARLLFAACALLLVALLTNPTQDLFNSEVGASIAAENTAAKIKKIKAVTNAWAASTLKKKKEDMAPSKLRFLTKDKSRNRKSIAAKNLAPLFKKSMEGKRSMKVAKSLSDRPSFPRNL